MPSAPEALAGGPTQAAPGVRGEEEEWAREIGAQLRRMADDLNAQYERRVSAGRGRGDGRWDSPAGRGRHTPPPDVRQLLPRARGRAGDRLVGVGRGRDQAVRLAEARGPRVAPKLQRSGLRGCGD